MRCNDGHLKETKWSSFINVASFALDLATSGRQGTNLKILPFILALELNLASNKIRLKRS